MHLIVTRPAQQARGWQAALEAAGYSTSLLALMEVAQADQEADLAAWQTAVRSASSYSAWMFVSSNAVEHFFKKNQPIALIKYSDIAINLIVNKTSPRCWATGPGTTAALLAAGVEESNIDAPAPDAVAFDSEALWQRVSPQIEPRRRVLIVRGRDVGAPESSRDWLKEQIQARGGQASSLVVYERRAPVFSCEQLALAQAWLRDGSVWLLSSSQALLHLPASLDVSRGVCICTHDRIAQAATQRGFAVVCRSRPTLPDVIASIKSMHV